VIEDRYFIYDGWNVIEETIAPATGPVETAEHVWGTDLSGTAQGAGGVGGLLLRESSANGASYYHYDGNGNVTALTSAAGVVQAAYTYGAFGETLRAAGPLAQANPWRFSTKYQDDETGLLYYGYRFYNPTDGRWMSRDPIGEEGSINLSRYVNNNPISFIDYLGLETAEFRVLTFIPHQFAPDPIAAVYAGDGDPGNFSPNRKSYRTYHSVQVKTSGFFIPNPTRDDIIKDFKDTGVSIRYRQRNPFEEIFGKVGLPEIHFGGHAYIEDARKKLDPNTIGKVELKNWTVCKDKDNPGQWKLCSLSLSIHGHAADPLGPLGTPAVDYHWILSYTTGFSETCLGNWGADKGWVSEIHADGFPSYIFGVNGKEFFRYDGRNASPLLLFGDASYVHDGPRVIK
jgi:RHS repeat-associated protein